MKIVINGQEQSVEPLTLAGLIEQLGMKPDRVAVELNRSIVARAQWAETQLAEGDHLEIVHFVGGGLGCGERLRRIESDFGFAPPPAQELL